MIMIGWSETTKSCTFTHYDVFAGNRERRKESIVEMSLVNVSNQCDNDWLGVTYGIGEMYFPNGFSGSSKLKRYLTLALGLLLFVPAMFGLTVVYVFMFIALGASSLTRGFIPNPRHMQGPEDLERLGMAVLVLSSATTIAGICMVVFDVLPLLGGFFIGFFLGTAVFCAYALDKSLE